jgi:signal transduction histidine kinase
MMRDGHRAAEVIARLRTLFARTDATPEPFDLNEATREVIALSSSELRKSGAMLRADLALNLPPVAGDRVQLQQVILNLLLNAGDAVRAVDDRPRQVIVRTEYDEDRRVRLTVLDAGVGVDPQSVQRLFEPFYSTKAGGMGIGLSISRSIIESYRGRIWVAPTEGPGSTFAFALPPTVLQPQASS